MARHLNLISIIGLTVLSCVLEPALNAQIVYSLPGGRGDSAVVADFNNDGIPDVAAVTRGGRSAHIAFFTGDGAGNFTQTSDIELRGYRANGPAVVTDWLGNGNPRVIVPTSMHGLAIVSPASYFFYNVDNGTTAVQFADIDGDGKPEMILSNGSLDVYRGSNGQYTKIGSYAGANDNLLLGDFNGDGKVDVAATVASGINIFPGNGDGSFRLAAHTDGPFNGIAAADFNHDGKLDLVAGTWDSPLITVLLGNGDGTFVAQPSNNTAQWHSAMVAVGDFNKDGNVDVAVADGCWSPGWPCQTDAAVTIMLGNGDGSLQLPVSYAAGGRVVLEASHVHKMFIASSDLDRNGDLDLIVANQLFSGARGCGGWRACTGTLAILLGNGDGTFQSAPVNNHYVSRTSLMSAPNPSTYGQAVTFSATVTSNGPDVPTGTVLLQAPHLGRHLLTLAGGVASFTTTAMIAESVTVTATYSGDNSQLASKAVPYVQTVNPATTTTAVTSSRNPSRLGQTVAFTATVTSAYATPKGTITFDVGQDAVATVPLVNGHAIYRTASLPVGSWMISATFNPVVNEVGGSNFTTSQGRSRKLCSDFKSMNTMRRGQSPRRVFSKL
jgi:hypothetical protein